MTDDQWIDIKRLIAQLWPLWEATEAHVDEYEYRLKKRPYESVEKSIRDHFAEDDAPYQPALSRILARCAAIAEAKDAATNRPTYEAREQMRLSNLDDAAALHKITKWPAERLQAAIRVAVAAECIQAVPRSDPEAWSKNERGFIEAADWLIETQPERARKIIENHEARS
jgi:hypothetical protein